MNLSEQQQKTAGEIITFFTQRIGDDPYISAISFQQLHSQLTDEQSQLVKTIQNINPADYGISIQKKPDYQIPPKNALDVIAGQKQLYEGEETTIPPRLATHVVFDTYTQMRQALKDETGTDLLVKSGYRSPAYQLFVFLFNLRENTWDINTTLTKTVPPVYSQHAHPKRHALDFTTPKIVDDETFAFEKTVQFRWLKKHAGDFGFVLSYPKGNEAGLVFEPWHWRYTGG